MYLIDAFKLLLMSTWKLQVRTFCVLRMITFVRVSPEFFGVCFFFNFCYCFCALKEMEISSVKTLFQDGF